MHLWLENNEKYEKWQDKSCILSSNATLGTRLIKELHEFQAFELIIYNNMFLLCFYLLFYISYSNILSPPQSN